MLSYDMLLDPGQRHSAKLYMESFRPSIRRQGLALSEADEPLNVWLAFDNREIPLTVENDGPHADLFCDGYEWDADCDCGRSCCKHVYAGLLLLLKLADEEETENCANQVDLRKAGIDLEAPLKDILKKAVGRKLAASEEKVLKTVAQLHRAVERGKRLTRWDLEGHFFFNIATRSRPTFSSIAKRLESIGLISKQR